MRGRHHSEPPRKIFLTPKKKKIEMKIMEEPQAYRFVWIFYYIIMNMCVFVGLT